MLNKERHQMIMGQILRDIYSDVSIAPLLGFKGGTCAYFFYNLPRFSADLDFDLMPGSGSAKERIFDKLLNIIKKYGEIKDQYVKRFTIFVLLSYGHGDRNIKIEINIRETTSDTFDRYELKEHLGISMLVAKKEVLLAGKLAALTLRKTIAMRDVYDINYFLGKNWEADQEMVHSLTGKKIKEYLSDCIAVVEKIKENRILQGLGDLLDEKEKTWARKNLKNETLFNLKNYRSALR